jgi:hypothetical protein
VAFRFFLRTGELLQLENRHILVADSTIILFLGITKTGPRNPHSGSAYLIDYQLAALLRHWKAQNSATARLIPWKPQKFRAIFQQVLVYCGLQNFNFKPYSLRRGGATNLWLTTHNYSAVCQMGRWSNERTMRLYIQDSLSLLNDIKFHMTPKRVQWITRWRQLSCVEPAPKGKGRGRGKKVGE